MKLIGLGHRKGVGKDTIGRMLERKLGERGKYAQCMAFADPVYEVAERLFGWTGQKSKAYYDTNPVEKGIPLPIGKTPREILIGIGDGLRAIYPAMWIELLLDRATKSPNDFVIITDVRYPNELLRIQELGGECYRVTRPGAPEPSDPADKALLGYEGKWDGNIHNNGTLENLDALLTVFIQRWI